MAKKPKGKSIKKKIQKKESCVIRLSRADANRILDALKVLKSAEGATAAAAAFPGSETVFKFLSDFHDTCCQSCPKGGKILVVDVEGDEK